MDTFVIPDVHGEYEALRRLLEAAGIVDGEERINDKVHVIQLGDIANCVDDSDIGDLACLDMVGPTGWIDLLLCGNHEYAYFGGGEFSGFKFKWPIFHRLALLSSIGRVACSAHTDGWLITHAGLGPMHNIWETAEQANGALRARWFNDPTDPIFSVVGKKRGGFLPEGGILWHDAREETDTTFKQLFGHTIGHEVRNDPQGRWHCLDIGMGRHTDKLVGAWIKKGEVEIFETS
jgi:Calcineurin-like phosphoesterase